MKHTQESIMARVHIDEEGHWLWQGYINPRTGYGEAGRHDDVHRVAYELWIGPIPEGAQLDHAKGCPKHCCNPYTLTPVDRDLNARLVWRRRRGQMGRSDLRCARLIHHIVTENLERERADLSV